MVLTNSEKQARHRKKRQQEFKRLQEFCNSKRSDIEIDMRLDAILSSVFEIVHKFYDHKSYEVTARCADFIDYLRCMYEKETKNESKEE